MNKDLLNYNLIKISDQLTTKQIIYSRRNRNWYKFDRLDEVSKLRWRLEELQIYEDLIDMDYDPYKSRASLM
jgi:hypothetical protein